MRLARIALALAIVFTVTVASSGRLSAAEDALTTEQKKAVEKIIRSYLVENPEILIEVMNAFRVRQEKIKDENAGIALLERHDEIFNSPYSPVGGNAEGDVTLVEFFDYRCGYCKKVLPSIIKLLKDDGNIRYVLKEYPVLGPQSVFATRLALAAWYTDQKKYMKLHMAMMGSRGNLTNDRVLKIAKKTGFDVKALVKAMSSPEVEGELARNMALADALNISGTPAFVIGDEVVRGAISYQSLKKHVATARKN